MSHSACFIYMIRLLRLVSIQTSGDEIVIGRPRDARHESGENLASRRIQRFRSARRACDRRELAASGDQRRRRLRPRWKGYPRLTREAVHARRYRDRLPGGHRSGRVGCMVGPLHRFLAMQLSGIGDRSSDSCCCRHAANLRGGYHERFAAEAVSKCGSPPTFSSLSTTWASRAGLTASNSRSIITQSPLRYFASACLPAWTGRAMERERYRRQWPSCWRRNLTLRGHSLRGSWRQTSATFLMRLSGPRSAKRQAGAYCSAVNETKGRKRVNGCV